MYGLTKTIAREKEEEGLPIIHDIFQIDLMGVTEAQDLDPVILSVIEEDLKERREFGETKYGVRLQPFDGNRPIVEAYQEILDASIYLCQAIIEEYSDERDDAYLDCIKLLFKVRTIIWWEDRREEERASR